MSSSLHLINDFAIQYNVGSCSEPYNKHSATYLKKKHIYEQVFMTARNELIEMDKLLKLRSSVFI